MNNNKYYLENFEKNLDKINGKKSLNDSINDIFKLIVNDYLKDYIKSGKITAEYDPDFSYLNIYINNKKKAILMSFALPSPSRGEMTKIDVHSCINRKKYYISLINTNFLDYSNIKVLFNSQNKKDERYKWVIYNNSDYKFNSFNEENFFNLLSSLTECTLIDDIPDKNNLKVQNIELLLERTPEPTMSIVREGNGKFKDFLKSIFG